MAKIGRLSEVDDFGKIAAGGREAVAKDLDFLDDKLLAGAANQADKAHKLEGDVRVDIRFTLFEVCADLVDEGDRQVFAQLRGIAVVNKKLIGAEEDVGVALKANAVDRQDRA